MHCCLLHLEHFQVCVLSWKHYLELLVTHISIKCYSTDYLDSLKLVLRSY